MLCLAGADGGITARRENHAVMLIHNHFKPQYLRFHLNHDCVRSRWRSDRVMWIQTGSSRETSQLQVVVFFYYFEVLNVESETFCCNNAARRRLWWRLKGSITDVLFRKFFRRCFHLTNVLPTLLSDKVSCKVNLRWSAGGIFRTTSIGSQSREEERGFESTALLWIGWENHGGERERGEEKKKKTHLWIMYSCWVCKTERKKKFP